MAKSLEQMLAERPVDRGAVEAHKSRMIERVRAYRLQVLRESVAMTQKQLAERLGVGQNRVSNIEHGDLERVQIDIAPVCRGRRRNTTRRSRTRRRALPDRVIPTPPRDNRCRPAGPKSSPSVPDIGGSRWDHRSGGRLGLVDRSGAVERPDQEARMPRPSSWLSTTASTLGGELARIGLTVPTNQLEDLITDRVAVVAEQMRITERTARQHFDHDTLRTLAHEMALIIKEEAPGADLLTLPRTTAMPLATLGATIAALVEVAALGGADKDPDEPATAMALISTLGVLARDHDGDLPAVRVPEPLLMRAARLIENTADLVHQGCPLPPDVAEDVRPHLQKTLREDAARLRALTPDTGGWSGSGLWAVPDDPS